MDIKIAICDDEPELCSSLENMLIDIFKTKDVPYEIEPFYSGESLCSELQERRFDLIFLDIQLQAKSGIDVGRFIRDELGDERIQIAYISSKTEYAMELFEFRPIHFLVKPLDFAKLAKMIDKYFAICQQNNYFFEYKKKGLYYKIPLSDILYFESRRRKVRLQMLSGEDEFYGSLEDIYQKVKMHQFLYIHKSFIINYRHIRKLAHHQVTLIDGSTLPISQSRRSAIKKMCMKIRKGER